MPVRACCDRSLPNAVRTLTAYQLQAPIHLRIVTPHISDFDSDGKQFSERISLLRTSKDAKVSLLVDRKWIVDFQAKNGGQNPAFIEKLEDMGVSILTVRNLHAKIMLLNAGKDKALLLGSSNFTHTGMHISHEADIHFLNDNSGTIEEINDYITELYKSARPT